MVMSVIILLAVGSDYNLLLVARFKEEIGAGLKTGIIRAMGGTGRVVTAAGLVFAFTMASMIVSDNARGRPGGHDHRLGLLFDTLVVRSVPDAVHRGDAGALVLVAEWNVPSAAATGFRGVPRPAPGGYGAPPGPLGESSGMTLQRDTIAVATQLSPAASRVAPTV